MKRSAIAASAALMVALLAGCSAPAGDAGPRDAAPTSSPALTAQTPTMSAEDTEALYLGQVRLGLPANTVIPDATDSELLAAGWQVCERLANGEDGNEMSVIAGEEPDGLGYYVDSAAIVSAANATLCG